MNYEIENPNYSAETRQHFNIYSEGHMVAWLITGKDLAPIVYFHANNHKIDRLALAKTIAEKWHDTEGTYFLVTEFVTLEDLQAKSSTEITQSTQP